MKDAFARINNGRVQYLGKNNDTISFFELSSYKADDMYYSFMLKYKNKHICVGDFWREIVEDTAYTSKDLNEAIKKLESDGKISVTRVSSKRGSYKEDDIINIL